MGTYIGIWIAAGLTLCIYSFLYKDNPFFKFAEHLFVGISAGYTIAMTWHEAILKMIWEPMKTKGDFTVLIPAVIGLLMFSRFIPKYRWMIRWPLAFMIGVGTGASIPRVMQSLIFEQTSATLKPVPFSPAAIDIIIIAFGVLCTLIYFFFSMEHKGPVGIASRVGVVFLMVSFGAGFGYTVMGRISLLIERMLFLLHNWLHLVK